MLLVSPVAELEVWAAALIPVSAASGILAVPPADFPVLPWGGLQDASLVLWRAWFPDVAAARAESRDDSRVSPWEKQCEPEPGSQGGSQGSRFSDSRYRDGQLQDSQAARLYEAGLPDDVRSGVRPWGAKSRVELRAAFLAELPAG